MKKTISAVVILFAIMILSAVVWAAETGGFRSFSAEMVTTSPQGTHTSKIFSTNLKQRMEAKAEGHVSVIISRMDKKVVWMCTPEQKMCMEMAINSQKQDIQTQMNDPNVKVQKDFLGNENVEGHATKKYHITIMRQGKKENSGFIWEAADLYNMTIKHQSEDKTITTVWKNISFSSIPDSLFEIPQGYQKMDMKNMPGMGGMGARRR